VQGIFNEKYLTTIGVKVDKKQVAIEQQDVQLLLWDLEGFDRYNQFQSNYIRGAAGFIIVVDQTRITSLHEAIDILNMTRQHSQAPAILAINKSDLQSTWNLQSEKLSSFQQLFNEDIHTSAKTGANVEEMFTMIAKLAMEGS